MEIPAGIAANAAIVKQNAITSIVKSSVEGERAIANVLAQAAENVPVSATRGNQLNITA